MKVTRIKEILDFIKNKQVVKVAEIEQQLNIPRTTLLRDLNTLESSGKIVKTFGEVQMAGPNVETSILKRLDDDSLSKIKIAKKAAKLVNTGDIIFIDAGSTTYFLAKELSNVDITIYTTNLSITSLINIDYVPRVVILPGEVNKKTLAISSEETILAIKNLNFDKAFVGYNSLVNNKYATTNKKEAITKQAAIEQSKQAYIIGKKSKANNKTTFNFASVKDAQLISEE